MLIGAVEFNLLRIWKCEKCRIFSKNADITDIGRSLHLTSVKNLIQSERRKFLWDFLIQYV